MVAKKPAGLLPANPKSVMSLLRARLRSEAGEGLSAFARGVLARSGSGALDLSEDPEVLRFLSRMGCLEGNHGEASRSARVARIVDELARSSGLEPLIVGLYLRVFASGEEALGLEAICGEMPRCRGCDLAGVCRYRQGVLSRPEPARTEHPALRLRCEGEESLSASELAALVLSGRGLSMADSLALSRRMLAQAGSLRGLASCPLDELASQEGMDEGLAVRLRAALALARRWSVEARERGRQFRAGRDFFEFFAPLLRDSKKESFFVVLLDQKNCYLGHERVSIGSLTGSLVHPREVFRPAIRDAAAAVAFVHNHPSGNPQPSQDDRSITSRLLEVARLVGLRVLDHVVIGEEGYFSFVEEGLF